jgi:hypothetical protein
MAKHLNCKERAANGSNHSVNGIPHRIDPRDFIGKELQQIENAGDGDDPRITKDLKRLVLRRQGDPVKMNSQTGGENCQVKVDPRKRGETERDGKQIQSLHQKNIGRNKSMSRASLGSKQMTNDEIPTPEKRPERSLCSSPFVITTHFISGLSC